MIESNMMRLIVEFSDFFWGHEDGLACYLIGYPSGVDFSQFVKPRGGVKTRFFLLSNFSKSRCWSDLLASLILNR